MIDPSIESLIRAIYDCVIDPGGWEDVLRRIVNRTHAVSATIEADMLGTKPTKSPSWNVDPFYAKAYRSRFHALNPFIPLRMTQMAEAVLSGNPITETAAYRASSFFNDFAKPQEWEAFINVSLSGPGSADAFALMRRQKTDFAEAGIEQLLTILAPHLRRACDLSGILATAYQTTNLLGDAIAAAGFGVILLSERGRIIYANPIAEDMLREQNDLAFIRDELIAEATPLACQLASMVKACVDPAAITYPLGTVLKLPRRNVNQPILLHVLPLQEKTAVMLTDRARPVAALFLVDPQRDLFSRLRSFGHSCALTSIETTILGEIICSEPLTTIAAKLGMSPSTLRMHLGRLMVKTRTNNRLELIRSFFEAFTLTPP